MLHLLLLCVILNLYNILMQDGPLTALEARRLLPERKDLVAVWRHIVCRAEVISRHYKMMIDNKDSMGLDVFWGRMRVDMKKVMKWSVGSFLAIIVLLVLSVELTGRRMSEERSQLGSTVVSSKNAITYLKELDVSFATPKMWKRYYPDTANQGIRGMIEKYDMQFAARQEENLYQLEVYADSISSDQLQGIDNLADASEEQKERFKEMVGRYLATAQTQEYTIEGNIEMSLYQTDNADFVVAKYLRKANAYKEYDAAA